MWIIAIHFIMPGAHNTGQNLNTGVSVFLIYEIGIVLLILVLKKHFSQ